MLKAITYELKPNATQRQAIRKACGCARFVYNMALAYKVEQYKTNKVSVSEYELDKLLTGWKKEYPFLSDCQIHALQQKIKDMCNAFGNIRKTGAGFPKFKKKGKCKETFRVPEPCRIDYNKWTCSIAKVGKVRIYKGHNKQISNIHSYTVEYRPTLDRYFVSILYETSERPQKEYDGTHCGIDVGIKTFATLSGGEVFENQKYLKSNLRKLRVLQRSAARKYKRGVMTEEQSRNWHKVQRQVAALHLHIVNQRKDFNHKLSRWIADNYYLVSVEDLAVKNMVRNHHLAQAINDVGWQSFLSMLEYKCYAFQKVDRFFASSQMCGVCGYKNSDVKDLAVRTWICPQCGTRHERDLNAAENIDREGLSLWRRKVSGCAMLAPEPCVL